jgi:hypothetical protein
VNAGQQQRVMQVTVPALYLDFLPETVRDKARDAFTYPIVFPAGVAAGATAVQTATFNNDSWFLLVALTARVTSDATFETVVADPALTLVLADSSAQRNLMSAPLDWSTYVGSGQLPSFLPYPKIFPQGAVAAATIANIGATPYTRVSISLLGFKIFNYPAATQRV